MISFWSTVMLHGVVRVSEQKEKGEIKHRGEGISEHELPSTATEKK